MLLAAPASAAEYCVGAPTDCPAGGIDQPTVQDALAAAQATGDPDTVRIGEGTFTTATGFGYAAGGSATNDVVIVGQGVGRTMLAADTPAKPGGFSVLAMTGSTVAASRLTGVSVRVPNTEEPGNPTRGVLLGRAEGDHLLIDDDGTFAGAGVGITLATGRLHDAEVRMNDGGGVAAVNPIGGVNEVEDVRVSGYHGVYATDAPLTTVRRATIDAVGIGLAAFRTTIDAESVLVTVGPEGVGARAAASTAPATVHASHLTVIGPAGEAGDTSTGLLVTTAAEGDARGEVDNAIFSDVTTSADTADGAGSGNPSATLANFYASGDSQGSVTEADRYLDAPVFAGNGDLRPRFDSPLLDVGTTDPVVASEGTDLAGGARVRDAKPQTDPDAATPDLGAYEYQASAPVAVLNGPDAVGQGETAVFDGTTSDPGDPGEAITGYAWTSSDAFTALTGVVSRAFPAPGDVALTLTVTDSNGQTDSATKTVAVAPTPSPSPAPTASPGPTGSPSPSPSPAPTVAPDRTAPTVKVALRKRRRLRVTLSEPASLVVTVKRGRKVVKRRARALAAGVATIKLGALARGRYRIAVVATDAAGNASKRIRRKLRVR